MAKYISLRSVLLLFMLAGMTWGQSAYAALVQVQITGLSTLGTSTVLALDLVDGDGPSNSVTLGAFATDGTAIVQGQTGGVRGSLSTQVVFNDSGILNELLVLLTASDSLSFEFLTSSSPPTGAAFVDAFSVFLLDPLSLLPSVATTDGSGAASLFRYEIDGSVGGFLANFSAVAGGVSWTVTVLETNPVPEPSTLALVLGALVTSPLMRILRWLRRSWGTRFRRARLAGCIVMLLGTIHVPAHAEDVTSSVSIARGGLVLNRVSGTFDATITVTNTSTTPLLGPVKVALVLASPANVAMYNSHGRLASGADFVVLPLPTGVLVPGASANIVVRLLTRGQAVLSTQFSVDATRMLPNNTAQIVVQGQFAPGYLGPQAMPVGEGFRVLINGTFRGLTDANGKLTAAVTTGAQQVSVQRAPNEGGSILLASVAAGATVNAVVPVDDGKQITADSRLRLDATQQGVLARNAAKIAFRFMDSSEQAVRLAVLYDVQVFDVLGTARSLTSLFAVQPDGSISASPSAFFQALGTSPGRMRFRVSGEDTGGAIHSAEAQAYLSDYKVRVRLVAPPSNPALPRAGVRLTATLLNTDLRFVAEADANGIVTLPDLPRGNLNLSATIVVGALAYVGLGSVPLTYDALLSLTMRAASDVAANVPPISVQPLPANVAAANIAQLPVQSAQASSASGYAVSSDPARQALHAALPPTAFASAAHAPKAAVTTMASTASVTVNVSAAAQNQVIENSATLTVPQGTKKLTLTYIVASAEYPVYVQAQSVYNDVWSLSVLSTSAGVLFEQTRQVNSQLTQEPVWLPNGTTGPIKKAIDVSSLTASGPANVILKATSVNIGDSALTTTVNAILDNSEPLTIASIIATADEITANNDGTYYSVPRPQATNTLARTLTVEIQKPSGSVMTAVNVELLNSANGSLMTVLQDVAPGADGVEVLNEDDVSARLKVRVTVSSPASTVASSPPPTRDIGYRIRVKGTSSTGTALSDEKLELAKRGLWRMPDGRPRYGSRDQGGDDWISRGGYNWIAANGALLRAIDDVSGEHGRNIGHTTHARGTDIDMYHFYNFGGAGTSGTANYNLLTADVISAFGTLQTTPPAGATEARDRVLAWLAATRAGLTNLAALASVSQLIYCRGGAAQGLAAGWCSNLIQTGSVTRTVSGLPSQTLDFGGSFSSTKLVWRNDHNNHVHITLDPAQIAE